MFVCCCVMCCVYCVEIAGLCCCIECVMFHCFKCVVLSWGVVLFSFVVCVLLFCVVVGVHFDCWFGFVGCVCCVCQCMLCCCLCCVVVVVVFGVVLLLTVVV